MLQLESSARMCALVCVYVCRVCVRVRVSVLLYVCVCVCVRERSLCTFLSRYHEDTQRNKNQFSLADARGGVYVGVRTTQAPPPVVKINMHILIYSLGRRRRPTLRRRQRF